jgi:5'-nucleotidase
LVLAIRGKFEVDRRAIVVSNDDGVYAPGLKILADTLRTVADIRVVAPDRNRSGASNSLTLDSPLRAKTLENGFISVEGTPTDCVHLAITGLLHESPQMVVTGINEGANLGDDVWYSGTVAAAMEGRFLGFPAIAISLVGLHHTAYDFQHFATAARVAKELVLRLQANPLPTETILNVNVPDVPYHELQGIAVTRLGSRHIAEQIVPGKDPRGNTIYWVGPAGSEQDAGLGTDFYAINKKQVSITPLQLDLTHYKVFDQLSEWTVGLLAEKQSK